MRNEKYRRMLDNPYKTEMIIGDDTKIVILSLVSCMCDNESLIKFTSNGKDKEPSLLHYSGSCVLAFSNLQVKNGDEDDLKWAFMDNDLNKIISILDSSTSKVFEVRIR